MNKLTRYFHLRAAADLADQIRERQLIQQVLSHSKWDIPVLVVSFNNGTYVQNMVAQLHERGITPLIIDNASSESKTIDILAGLEKEGKAAVARSRKNLRHLVGFLEPVYRLLPEAFAYTDPDLQFHPDMPLDFLPELLDLTREYECFKAGVALDISNPEKMINAVSYTKRSFPFTYSCAHTIVEWEKQFWALPLKHEKYEVYAAPIDTTFAVYQKKYFLNGDLCRGVRVAGNFTACHLPWYPDRDLFSEQDRAGYVSSKSADSGMWVR